MNKYLILFISILIPAALTVTSCTARYVNEEKSLKKQLDECTQQLEAEKVKTAELNTAMAAEQKKNDVANKQLVDSLKDEIQKNEISIKQFKDILVINIAERVLFDTGKADIKTQYYPILNKIGGLLRDQSNKFIQIEGHTDDIPIAAEYLWKIPNNWALGARRAIVVTKYFIDNYKLDPKMIGVMSFSKYRPLVPNTNEVNRAKNRRIEIILLGKRLYEQIYIKVM